MLAAIVLAGCTSSRADDSTTFGSTTADEDSTSTTDGSTSGAVSTSTSTAATSATASTSDADTTGDPLADCFNTWTFDACPDDWTIGSADPNAPMPPSWECGEPPATISLGGAHSGVWATALAGDYPPNTSAYLASPSFSLADCAGASIYLSFSHLYQFGVGDGGTVQISLDDGASWTTVEPSWYGYCDGALDVPWMPPGGEPGFCGGGFEEVWVHSLVALDEYGGEPSVQVRFVFGSDGIIEQLGWFIDDVITEAY